MTDSRPGDGVRVVTRGRVRYVTLDRPDRANALDDRTVATLRATLDDAVADDVRAVVLQSTGRAFCAGFDMGDLTAATDGDLTLRFLRVGELLEALYAAPLVTVACVQGPAIGAGADLVAACDHRIAEPAASFGFPGAAFDIVLGTRRLANLVGGATAVDLVSSGRRARVEEAVGTGLVTEAVGAGEAEARAGEIVADLCRLDPDTYRRVVQATRPDHPGRGLADLATSLARNPDLVGRVRAFRTAQRPSSTATK